MARRLFCELCPFTYKLSVWKSIALRKLQDLPKKRNFARLKFDELLPEVIYEHSSLIRRTLGNVNKTLIIDAKYYTHTTQMQYDVHTLHSNNLYQVFTYVKNKASKGGEVSGMLLYAKTDEEIYPNNEYQMSGNKITVRTLDLNCDFESIAAQLDNIVQQHFNL